MKIMCRCGRDVNYEPPFDDFHVERVPCTATCERIKAIERDVGRFRGEESADPFSRTQMGPKPRTIGL